MKAGDKVYVYPVGSPDRKAPAEVVMVSGNQQAIALGLGDQPVGFRISGEGVALHPEHGIMLLAHRDKPIGPWTEMFHQDLFEIEKPDERQD